MMKVLKFGIKPRTGTLSSNKEMIKAQFRTAFFVACFMEIIHSVASLTDAYYIGNYMGSFGMAAMSCARPFFSFIDIICGPLGLGMQLMCSNAIGKGEIKHAQKIFSGSLLTGLLISIILAGLGLLYTASIASMYGTANNTADVIPMASQYMKGLFIGVPAMIIFGILSPIVQLGNGKRLIMISVIFQLISDVIGDSLTVFVFDGGMFGLGLATALSYYFSIIPLVSYFFRSDAILKLHLSSFMFADLRKITKAGASKSIKRICNTIKPIVMNALSLMIGTSLALSAYGITNQIRDFLISFSAGISSATLLIGVLLYSQRDRDGLKSLSRISLTAICCISLLGGVCIIFAKQIAECFVSDSDEVLKMATLSVRCVGIMIPFSALNGIFIAFQQITQRYKLANILSYLNRLVFIVFTSVFLGFCFGTCGLWWAIPVSEVLNILICLFIIIKRLGRFPTKVVDILCLTENFGFKTEDYIEVTLHDKTDMVVFRNGVKDFCVNHGIESRRSFFTQLALEELVINVMEHGFPKCKKNPQIHIWITYDSGDIRLRFQDNCPGFNVMKYCTALRELNTEHSVGLRIVSQISKQMDYVNFLGTNNLIITI